jgi:hypothetical protein
MPQELGTSAGVAGGVRIAHGATGDLAVVQEQLGM